MLYHLQNQKNILIYDKLNHTVYFSILCFMKKYNKQGFVHIKLYLQFSAILTGIQKLGITKATADKVHL